MRTWHVIPWLLFCLSVEAVELSQAIGEARREVGAAIEALNDFRTLQEQARQPLAEEVETLQDEVRTLRKEAALRRTAQQQSQREQEAVQREVDRMSNELEFIHGLLTEYRRATETRRSIAGSIDLQAELQVIDDKLLPAEQAETYAAATQALLELAETSNLERVGGRLFAGTCLDASGTERDGTLAELGPLTWFATQDGAAASLVVSQLGSSYPVLAEGLSAEASLGITDLTQGREADVLVDLTQGDALKAARAPSGLKHHLLAGGFVMIPLLIIGVLAALLALFKFLALTTVRAPSASQLDALVTQLRAHKLDEAKGLLRKASKPFAIILKAGVDHPQASREHLEELMHERALTAIPLLDRHLGMLAVLGGVAPLLGLLGTVTGMIHTFEQVTLFGTGNAKVLSGGISEALITTETGLIIAVPVLLVHALLSRRVKTLVVRLEQAAIAFANRLHAAEEPNHA